MHHIRSADINQKSDDLIWCKLGDFNQDKTYFVGTLRNSTMMVILLSFQVRRTICRIFTDVKTLCFLPQICNASKCLEMPRNALTRLQNTYILYYHTSILSTVYNALEANFKSTVMRKSAKEFNTFGLLISSLIAKSKVPIHTYYLPH